MGCLASVQVEQIREAALSKCSMLYRKMQSYKSKMEYYERENKEMHDTFEERVSEFRKQMPRSMQELDGESPSNPPVSESSLCENGLFLFLDKPHLERGASSQPSGRNASTN